ncbi:MAG: hypothetical protein NT029_16725, partial [Armatimonadetes bacterium]|nr:hypothetical protein [Armatimonadota bacterium]
MALDSAGAATVVGYTGGTGFPTTTGAYQTLFGGGTFDAYVSKISFGATTQPTTITADAVTCYASDTITLTGTLTKTSDSSALSGKTIQFKVDAGGTWTNASAATGADGKATLSATAPATTGAHTIYVRFEGDTDYVASDGSNTLTIDDAVATTLVADDASAAPSASVTVSATLTKTTGATAVAGLRLEFRIGDSGAWTNAAALTDATGKASASLAAPATTGDATINARWAGSTHYAASSDTATLAVKTATTITADAVTCYASDTITLTGTLKKTSDSTAISGKTIQFKIDAGGTWTNAAAATGADGKATLSVTAPATTGAHTIYVRFEADTYYAASDASNTLTIDAADGTTLVADDASAAPGASVTVSATLTKTTGATAVAGLQLEFRIGDSGAWTDAAALTDATGKASASLTAPATAGDATINARWAG